MKKTTTKLIYAFGTLVLLLKSGFNQSGNAQSTMAPPCDLPLSTSGASTGGTFPFAPTIDNINGAIDGSLIDNDAAIFNLFLSAGSAFWQFDINFDGSYTGDIYINSRVASSIFSATILQEFTITAFNNSTQVWSVNAGSSFASWRINFGNSSVGYIPAPNTLPYNRIQLRFGGGLNLSPIGEAFRIIEIRRVPFKPDLPAVITFNANCGVKTLTRQNATNIANNMSYQWYRNGVLIPGASGLTYTTPSEFTAVTYSAIATVDNGCSFAPTIRNDTATVSFAVCTPLPITLQYFDVNFANCEAKVDWQTAKEDNVNRFEIETSRDGKDFDPMARINSSGKGNTYTKSISTVALAAGPVFFRLKMIDNDGTSYFSPVKKIVNTCSNTRYQLSPNPINNGLFRINGSIQGDIVSVYLSTGKFITAVKLNNSNENVDLSKLAPGIYIIKLTSKDTGLSSTFKVLKAL